MRINDIIDLAFWCGVGIHGMTPEDAEKKVARYLFKYTVCGVTFSSDEYGLQVGGYCEGVDGEPLPHQLPWGCTSADFEEAVDAAEMDAAELWSTTHGCDVCLFAPGVDPDCPECDGEGVVI